MPWKVSFMSKGYRLILLFENHLISYVPWLFKHQDWMIDVAQGFPNDIAILTLSSPAPVSRADIYPIQLPSPSASFDGDICYIMGWGMTSSKYIHKIRMQSIQERNGLLQYCS